jgi:hypothetical protein
MGKMSAGTLTMWSMMARVMFFPLLATRLASRAEMSASSVVYCVAILTWYWSAKIDAHSQ